MGKQNKNPGKRWQELLGLTAVPYFGQDTIPYQDEEDQEFVFDPETMSLINPIDIESGLYNKNAFEAGLYTPMYDENDVFLGYAYNNEDFAYLDKFLNNANYTVLKGGVSINEEKQQVTANSVSMFISDEFTTSTKYELMFTYELNMPETEYRNVIFYGFDSECQNGYRIGIDLPRTTGLNIETVVDGEVEHREKCADNGFSRGIYEVKIVRNGSDATIYVDDEEIGTIDNVQRNTFGLCKWGFGFSSVRDIFLKEIPETPKPETPGAQDPSSEIKIVNISATVTDGKNPINGVSITLKEKDKDKTITATTGTAGGCTLSNVPIGDYNVKATHADYEEYNGTITVTKDTETLNITMTASATP